MAIELQRGETRDFSLVLDLLTGEYLTEDYDVVFMVKWSQNDPNTDAVIDKRLRGEGATLTIEQTSGPDPETGEGNVAVVSGTFTGSEISGLFTGFNQWADRLTYHAEVGIVDPDGTYVAMIEDTMIIENSVVHLPIS